MSNIVEFPRDETNLIDAERAVLACMLLNPDTLVTALFILGDLGPDVFTVEEHRAIFEAMRTVHSAGTDIDIITLCEALMARGEIEAAGGCAYIAELTDAVPNSANIRYYAEIVRDAAARRGGGMKG